MNKADNQPLRPPALLPGDTVGLIAPASPLIDLRDISRARRVLTELGFQVLEGDHIRCRHGFLAGTDNQRAEDIHRMFSDSTVRAVIALRGGYGCGRLLELIDWDLLRANPKVLVGHSDLTALLNAVHERSGMVTFWGPMAGYDLGRSPSPFKIKHLRKVTSRTAEGSPVRLPASAPSPRRRKLRVISPGAVEGRLVGGNLSIIASLIGTPYEIATSGRLFFFEDVDEEPYKMDRMLNQLSLAGKLKDAAGIIVGRCVDCESSGRMKRTFPLSEVLAHWLTPLGVPVIHGLPIGHESDKLTLPIGVKARLDADGKPAVTLLEPAVK